MKKETKLKFRGRKPDTEKMVFTIDLSKRYLIEETNEFTKEVIAERIARLIVIKIDWDGNIELGLDGQVFAREHLNFGDTLHVN